ncbi:sensor histidine kinase [Stackebrandtia albiflava]|nr:histidine kinase [Stackebrandtia albiflava]
MWRVLRRSAPDTLLGAPVAALSIVMVLLAMPTGKAVGVSTGIVVAHLALAVRRRAPLSSFGLVCAGFTVQVVMTGLFLTVPSAAVFPVALYSVTARGGRAGPWVAAVAGPAGAGVATWRFVNDSGVVAAELRPHPVLVFVTLTAVCAVGVSLGLYRRTQAAYVAVLEERARDAEARRAGQAAEAVRRERQRIAREMHDIVSHSLAVVVGQAKGGRYVLDDPVRVGGVLSTIEDTGRQALTDMRGLLGVLRPDTDDPGSPLGPQPGLRELPELLRRTRDAGLTVGEHHVGTTRRLSPAAELAVYRLVQEALTNAVKHGGPEPGVTLELRWEAAGLRVRVANTSIATGPRRTGPGHGLTGMRERVAAVGGSVTAGPDGAGFTVTARVPYQRRPDGEGDS